MSLPLPTCGCGDYTTLWAEILARCGLSGSRAGAAFHQWTKQQEWEPCAQTADLLWVADQWLQPGWLTDHEVVQQPVVNDMLCQLPTKEHRVTGTAAPLSIQDLIGALKIIAANSTLKLAQGWRTTAGDPPHLGGMPTTPGPCSMPTEPVRLEPGWQAAQYTVRPPRHDLHDHPLDEAPASRGSPSAWYGPLERQHSGTLSVTCVHGDVREVLTVEVGLVLGEGEWPVVVGV